MLMDSVHVAVHHLGSFGVCSPSSAAPACLHRELALLVFAARRACNHECDGGDKDLDNDSDVSLDVEVFFF